ncbi:hypothetical protein [Mesorhizobium erdmanii]|uniref:hypothetical protein n=1 Tax=Mesorhizobium erdmanii TaxID=1777866 RepID=UPI0012DB1D00|nr:MULTISPECIES: hypothetical protein [Mesorhizobium]
MATFIAHQASFPLCSQQRSGTLEVPTRLLLPNRFTVFVGIALPSGIDTHGRLAAQSVAITSRCRQQQGIDVAGNVVDHLASEAVGKKGQGAGQKQTDHAAVSSKEGQPKAGLFVPSRQVRNQTEIASFVRMEAITMKKLRSGLILLALIVSACDNRLPPTKAAGTEQSGHASIPVMDAGTVGK